MANVGFYCADGYLKRTAKLSDQELGRLFRACMIYHATGEVTELTGRESIAFDFIREDIDAANEAYQVKCEINRRNRLGQTDVNDRQRPSTTVNDGEGNLTKGNVPGEEKEKEKKEEKEKEKDMDDGCAGASPAPASPPVITIPLNDGTEWGVGADFLREMEGLYPAVDVMQQLRNMRGWSISNPGKRKTKKGIQRFITSWLAAEQDKGRRPEAARPAGRAEPVKTVTAQQYEQRDYSGKQKELMDLFLRQNGMEPDQ